MNEKLLKVCESLKQNNINCIIVDKKEEISGIVENMLFDGCSITAGGSVSLKESGVWDLISRSCYNFIDRSKEGINPKEKIEAFRSAIDCDFFFCSSNAITKNGELVNTDGFGNRISSIAFGPKKVVAIIGANKIVKDIDEAFLRIKKIAAPKNCVRLNIKSPCYHLGHCISLENNSNPSITDGCKFERRICSNHLITGWQQNKERITVILCKEELGY